MKVNKICIECECAATARTDRCPRCCRKKNILKAFEKIEVGFKPLTQGNLAIFSLYLESLKVRAITGSDVALARKFARYLGRNLIGPLNSWIEVLETSRRVNLRYSCNVGGGCPIMQIGRELERSGTIMPLEKEKAVCRSRSLEKMSPQVRDFAKRYFEEVTHKRSARYGLTALTIIRRWELSLGSKKILSDGTEADAKAFIATVPKSGPALSGEFIRHMRYFYDWLATQNYIQVNPFEKLDSPKVRRRCAGCKKEKNFFDQGRLCGQCCSVRHSHKRLDKIKLWGKESDKLQGYNREIFKLYLRYVGRHHVDGMILKDTGLFFNFLLQRTDMPTARTWFDIAQISNDIKIFTEKKSSFKRGCPAIKVARVLQELGVIPIREEDYALVGMQRKIDGLGEDLVLPLGRYVEYLRKARRSESTICAIVHGIRKYYDWLKSSGDFGLWTASEATSRSYLASCKTDIGAAYHKVYGFYQWAKSERYTLINPMAGISLSSKKQSLKVCSTQQIRKIEGFIKSTKSDPESAVILALVLYWGIKVKELAFASVEFEDQEIKIIFHHGKLTCRNNRYNRAQVFALPQSPPWFNILQKRFICEWHAKFKNVRVDLPRQPLILHPRGRHNRPLLTLAIRRIYYRAIEAAIGARIPPNILRRAGADLYSRQGGSGVLQRMGWSAGHAFKFTWMPREFFRPGADKK